MNYGKQATTLGMPDQVETLGDKIGLMVAQADIIATAVREIAVNAGVLQPVPQEGGRIGPQGPPTVVSQINALQSRMNHIGEDVARLQQFIR